ncbi:uncharacterized protein LOC107646833 [Arachis ipaensis]|uniref:uncharacterized protein LOC107646833 n=1 Tax=Arachis ipaensis TaxID=130454 RepID=UPI0007AF5253|nr:uncharacterized protein LOC107646833 [Arachis ipaensis]
MHRCNTDVRICIIDDVVDDYVRIGQSTTIEYFSKFVEGVISVFDDEYLRKPNSNDAWIDRSPVFDDILNDCALEVNYTINGNNYTMRYYLADGIYLECATFVKSISKPQGEKCKLFAQYQKGQRKDEERELGVLQAHFAIIRGPSRFWKKNLADIMIAYIILHNLIVEDKRDNYAGNFAQGLEYDDVKNGLS